MNNFQIISLVRLYISMSLFILKIVMSRRLLNSIAAPFEFDLPFGGKAFHDTKSSHL